MTIIGELEIYEPDGRHSRESIGVDERTLPTLLDSLTKRWSASLRLRRRDQELVVSSSHGHFAVFAAQGDDEFYDLVGSPQAVGAISFAHGGQEAEHHRRHLVSPENVRAIISQLLMDRLTLDPTAWERQS
jgi:hypothetical protein